MGNEILNFILGIPLDKMKMLYSNKLEENI